MTVLVPQTQYETNLHGYQLCVCVGHRSSLTVVATIRPQFRAWVKVPRWRLRTSSVPSIAVWIRVEN